MIDEKMIEKYAEDYAYHNCSEEESYAAYKAFIAGINWFLGNLWHDASKEPKTYKRLMAKRHLDKTEFRDLMFIGIASWNKKVEYEGITRWLYIDDLLKGGK